MTGIERLHKLIADIDVSADPGLWYILRRGTEGGWDCEEHDDKTLGGTLAAIADQIEREQGGRVSFIRVLSVVTEMERHCLGHEGMEDSPVARWARELREALGALHAPGFQKSRKVANSLTSHSDASDVSMSAYDLLPADEREAITWVREHGGLDSVKKLLDWVVGHCSTKQQLDFDFWLSGRVMYELGFDEDMTDRDEVERRLLARLMPEGYEWPRYESGEPLRYEDRYVYNGREREVWHVDFDSYGEPTILNKDGTRSHPDKGERVERPAPKVLDADGAEIREGDRVWSTQLDEPHEWVVIDPHEDRGYAQTVLVSIGDRTGHARPENLTHRAPVIAADGEPLEVGQTVYVIANGKTHHVTEIDTVSKRFRSMEQVDGSHWLDPMCFTHQRPVLDADGVPIHEGDTVWLTDGSEGHVVLSTDEDAIGNIVTEIQAPGLVRVHISPRRLTHERPDSWERIEGDATLSPEVYCHRNGIDISQKDGTEIFLADTVEPMARDLVRRCRALAERDWGEA